ncbi:hypothetical protein [Stappia indica]|uniref:Alpha/beta hydrolase n=1 Tax=Stappia indica TaxID=538381 RepID=A0A857C8L3_9HYPH|nr:hypothetical protein [Stappia indica]QGZ35310.1 hypothetical protein GH266_12900 [Stappia indica]
MNDDNSGTSKVRKRRVIYIPGYDLRRPETVFSQLTEELARFLRLRSVSGSFSGLRPGAGSGGSSVDWTGEITWPEGVVTTRFSLLGWRDLSKRDFRRPLWAVIAGAVRTFVLFAMAGGYRERLRANWMNGLFFLYPMLALLMFLVASIVPALLFPFILPGTGPVHAALSVAAGLAWMISLYQVTRLVERWTYLWYLIQDWYSIGRLARNEDPQMTARIAEFAERIIGMATECEPDEEFVLVAHSSGTFVLLYTLREVLKRVPDFGAAQGQVTVLTMGSAFGYVGGFGAQRGFGAAVASLAQARHLDWTDVYAPHDILCCGKTTPVATYAPWLARHVQEPRRFSVRVPDRMTAGLYRHLRFRFFKLHFCYFLASERADLFDFYRLTLGPLPAARQLGRWEKSLP